MKNLPLMNIWPPCWVFAAILKNHENDRFWPYISKNSHKLYIFWIWIKYRCWLDDILDFGCYLEKSTKYQNINKFLFSPSQNAFSLIFFFSQNVFSQSSLSQHFFVSQNFSYKIFSMLWCVIKVEKINCENIILKILKSLT